jgi:hypothetical protein
MKANKVAFSLSAINDTGHNQCWLDSAQAAD